MLKLSTDPKQRANAFFNRGSAWDNLGQLERALQVPAQTTPKPAVEQLHPHLAS